MKLAKPGLWIGLLSALAVVWFVWNDRTRSSPGPVSAVHAQDLELAEQGCDRCHGGIFESLRAACAECHAEVEAEIAGAKGFHGTRGRDLSRCGECHSEHHGRELALVTEKTFASAGVADAKHFDHAGLALTLSGKHIDLACAQCHKSADDVLLAKGKQRFLGVEQRCTACHEDPHLGALPDCAACHGQEQAWKTVATFEHTRDFPLNASHGGLSCSACHPKQGPNSVEALNAARAGSSKQPVRTCEECHASAHSTSFLANVAADAHMPRGASCALCHPSTHTNFATPDPAKSKALHGASGFALAAPHDKQDCRACHTELPPKLDALSFAKSYPGRKLEDCAACHADPHAGQFTKQACLDCHELAHFMPPRFGVGEHERTSFPLTGKHRETACGDCHTELRDVARQGGSMHAERVFHPTKGECSDCHPDAHRDAFDGKPGCERCHSTENFVDVPAARFDHAQWTKLPLEGAHARAQCTSCHTLLAAPDETKRTFGRIASHAGLGASSCNNCHTDAHAGFFESGQACASCHSAESFADRARDFDHATRAGFALAGAHAREDCTICHTPSASADATGRRFGRSGVHAAQASASCTSCHADVHAGAFDGAGLPASVDGRKGCERCHTNERFDELAGQRFDHGQWTHFELEGAHAEVACAACHVPLTTHAVDGRRFERAAGSACQDCHADVHAGQFTEAGQTDCARCHASSKDFKGTSFDHQHDSRFALDATHIKLACSACHLDAPLQGGGHAVRYKPLATQCSDCHATGNPKQSRLVPSLLSPSKP